MTTIEIAAQGAKELAEAIGQVKEAQMDALEQAIV